MLSSKAGNRQKIDATDSNLEESHSSKSRKIENNSEIIETENNSKIIENAMNIKKQIINFFETKFKDVGGKENLTPEQKIKKLNLLKLFIEKYCFLSVSAKLVSFFSFLEGIGIYIQANKCNMDIVTLIDNICKNANEDLQKLLPLSISDFLKNKQNFYESDALTFFQCMSPLLDETQKQEIKKIKLNLEIKNISSNDPSGSSQFHTIIELINLHLNDSFGDLYLKIAQINAQLLPSENSKSVSAVSINEEKSASVTLTSIQTQRLEELYNKLSFDFQFNCDQLLVFLPKGNFPHEVIEWIELAVKILIEPQYEFLGNLDNIISKITEYTKRYHPSIDLVTLNDFNIRLNQAIDFKYQLNRSLFFAAKKNAIDNWLQIIEQASIDVKSEQFSDFNLLLYHLANLDSLEGIFNKRSKIGLPKINAYLKFVLEIRVKEDLIIIFPQEKINILELQALALLNIEFLQVLLKAINRESLLVDQQAVVSYQNFLEILNSLIQNQEEKLIQHLEEKTILQYPLILNQVQSQLSNKNGPDIDLMEIEKNLEKQSNSSSIKELTLEEILVCFKENPNNIGQINSSILDSLAQQIGHIREIIKVGYSSIITGKNPIADWNEEDIKSWAKEIKNKKLDFSKLDTNEVLAVISQSIKIFTSTSSETKEGYFPRDTQYITVLLFLKAAESGKSRLGQVATGEGKTITSAMLAIFKALSGITVDIVTSSSILAERDAKNNEPLYKMFGLTVSNICSETCKLGQKKLRDLYKSDIVYGDIGSFQRDFLLDNFYENDITNKRASGCIIVDEVDSMLIDKGQHVLYLSETIYDLRHLRHLFIEIWKAVHAPDVEDSLPGIKLVEAYIKKLIDNQQILLPRQLHSFVSHKMQLWIKSAFIAMKMKENDPYIILHSNNSFSNSGIIIMDNSTGVEQLNSQWENGLHQFLQLKHSDKISYESLKSIFIANVTYLNRFKNKIYGMTGTLGSAAERNLIATAYQADFFYMPSFRESLFQQNDDKILTSEQDWLHEIVKDVKEKIANFRSILIICENVLEVRKIESELKQGGLNPNLYESALKNFTMGSKENPLQPHQIILATNIAGRGTDLDTSKPLEANGGLHVILSYMPPNLRIEQQAFGRTARQGKRGSGRFIVNLEQASLNEIVKDVKEEITNSRSISEIKKQRDIEEIERLERIRMHDLSSINMEAELFEKFKILYKNCENILKALVAKDGTLDNRYVELQLKELKKRWAFWLDQVTTNIDRVAELGKDILIKNFTQFEREVNFDVTKDTIFKLVNSLDSLVNLGIYFDKKGYYGHAIKCFDEAIKEEPLFSEVAHYYKSACVLKRNGSGISEKKLANFHLKSAKKILEMRSSSLNEGYQILKTTHINSEHLTNISHFQRYEKQIQEQHKLLSVHLKIIYDVIGNFIDTDFIKDRVKSVICTKDAKAILGTLSKNNQILIGYRVNKKLEIKNIKNEQEIIIKKLGIDHEINLPKQYDYCKNELINLIKNKTNQKSLEQRIISKEEFNFIVSKETFWEKLKKEKLLEEEGTIEVLSINQADLQSIDFSIVTTNKKDLFINALNLYNGHCWDKQLQQLLSKHLKMELNQDIFSPLKVLLKKEGQIKLVKKGVLKLNFNNTGELELPTDLIKYQTILAEAIAPYFVNQTMKSINITSEDFLLFDNNDESIQFLWEILVNEEVIKRCKLNFELNEQNQKDDSAIENKFQQIKKSIEEENKRALGTKISVSKRILLKDSEILIHYSDKTPLHNFKKEIESSPILRNLAINARKLVESYLTVSDYKELWEVLMECNLLIEQEPVYMIENVRQSSDKIPEKIISYLNKNSGKIFSKELFPKLIWLDVQQYIEALKTQGYIKKCRYGVLTLALDLEKKGYVIPLELPPSLQKWHDITLCFINQSDLELLKRDENIFEALKDSAGKLKTIDQIKINYKNLSEYVENVSQAELEEFEAVGFDRVIELTEQTPWHKILAVVLLGIVQIALGVAITALSCGAGTHLGTMLIGEGVGDVLFAIEAAINGKFSWNDYLQHKKLSIVTSALTFGISAYLSKGAQVAKTLTQLLRKVAIEFGSGLSSIILDLTMGKLQTQLLENLKEDLMNLLDKFIFNDEVIQEFKCKAKVLYETSFEKDQAQKILEETLQKTFNQILQNVMFSKEYHSVVGRLSGAIADGFAKSAKKLKLENARDFNKVQAMSQMMRYVIDLTNYLQKASDLALIVDLLKNVFKQANENLTIKIGDLEQNKQIKTEKEGPEVFEEFLKNCIDTQKMKAIEITFEKITQHIAKPLIKGATSKIIKVLKEDKPRTKETEKNQKDNLERMAENFKRKNEYPSSLKLRTNTKVLDTENQPIDIGSFIKNGNNIQIYQAKDGTCHAPMNLASLKMLSDMERRNINVTDTDTGAAILIRPHGLRWIQALFKKVAIINFIPNKQKGYVGHFTNGIGKEEYIQIGDHNCGMIAFLQSLGREVTEETSKIERNGLEKYTKKHSNTYDNSKKNISSNGLDYISGSGRKNPQAGPYSLLPRTGAIITSQSIDVLDGKSRKEANSAQCHIISDQALQEFLGVVIRDNGGVGVKRFDALENFISKIYHKDDSERSAKALNSLNKIKKSELTSYSELTQTLAAEASMNFIEGNANVNSGIRQRFDAPFTNIQGKPTGREECMRDACLELARQTNNSSALFDAGLFNRDIHKEPGTSKAYVRSSSKPITLTTTGSGSFEEPNSKAELSLTLNLKTNTQKQHAKQGYFKPHFLDDQNVSNKSRPPKRPKL